MHQLLLLPGNLPGESDYPVIAIHASYHFAPQLLLGDAFGRQASMRNNKYGETIIFLLGAGFSIDAASESGYPSGVLPVSGLPARYPLVSDLLTICFNKDILPPDKSIEGLFQDSIDKGNSKPLDALYDYIMELDYYITPSLRSGGNNYNNIYIKFLRDFLKSPLITFNYDSIPEILLLGEQLWSPIDGYGLPVQTQQSTLRKGEPYEGKSLRPVLHLHGSVCIYPSTYYFEKQPEQDYPILKDYNEPKFLFDPDKLGHCFLPFERIPPGVTYTRPIERVIAPIPNKTEGLKGEFIEAVYRKAMEFLISAYQIIVIGYSFNPNDYASYAHLLGRMVEKPVLLIAPDAWSIIKRLAYEYPNIQWEAQSISLKEWVNKGYPGVRK